jgi:hypothetical protein
MSSEADLSSNVQELLEDLDLFRLPVVPQEVCQKLGIEYREYWYEGIEGTLLVIGSQQLIGVNANTKEPTRKAFTCAHELGHYYFDLDEGKTSFTCSSNDVGGSRALDRRELRANQFAAELLMPKALIEPLIRWDTPHWETIQDLAEECGTSLQATAQRYVDLSPHDCWVAVLTDGKIRRYHKPDRLPIHLRTKQTFIVPRNASEDWQRVSAQSWMGQSKQALSLDLAQSFLPENQYGDTLALLWDTKGQLPKKLPVVIRPPYQPALWERALTTMFRVSWALLVACFLTAARSRPRRSTTRRYR